MQEKLDEVEVVPSIMGIREAAEFTGYSVKYIYRLTSEKRIPHYKPQGGRLVFKRDELEGFLLRGKIDADYEVEAAADAALLLRKLR